MLYLQLIPKQCIIATAYHGSAALFDRFDPSHVLEGDDKFKFGVGAYLTSRYTTAAHYSGATSSPDHYVYTVQIPDLTPDNHLRSLSPPCGRWILLARDEGLFCYICNCFRAMHFHLEFSYLQIKN